MHKVLGKTEHSLVCLWFGMIYSLLSLVFFNRDVNNVRTNQDQLAVKLYQFSRSNDPVVVNIVFSKIKGLGQRAEDLIDYVSSIEMVTDARSSILQNHM